MFHKLIKVPTEEGKINCWKLDDDGAGWEVVPRRSERAKKILKNANL
jgi:hypothetical protein